MCSFCNLCGVLFNALATAAAARHPAHDSRVARSPVCELLCGRSGAILSLAASDGNVEDALALDGGMRATFSWAMQRAHQRETDGVSGVQFPVVDYIAIAHPRQQLASSPAMTNLSMPLAARMLAQVCEWMPAGSAVIDVPPEIMVREVRGEKHRCLEACTANAISTGHRSGPAVPPPVRLMQTPGPPGPKRAGKYVRWRIPRRAKPGALLTAPRRRPLQPSPRAESQSAMFFMYKISIDGRK